jgi:hypothetical protein
VSSEHLCKMSKEIKQEFTDVFSPIPYINALPLDVYYQIKLKDANKIITSHAYSTQKYKDTWAVLLQQHLDGGWIHLSSSSYSSPAFVIPKANVSVLPHWVNDYWILNVNTVPDAHLLPQIDDILANCVQGKIWSKLDMTNAFFQTWVHPNDVHLMAVSIPFRLYKWLAMPMGIRNAPSIHQR